jgi:alpha-beta hydrolase superfamily lysophospholipase
MSKVHGSGWSKIAFIPLVALMALLPSLPGLSESQAPANPFAEQIGRGIVSAFDQVDEELSKKLGTPVTYRVRYTKWLPDESPKKVVIYNHGFQSHRAWMNATANRLAEDGYAVYAFDRIGSGESDDGAALRSGEIQRSRGHVQSWELFLATLDEVTEIAAKEHPQTELVLWGNSYGAKLVTAYLHSRSNELERRNIRGAIFTTPGLFQNKKSMPLPFSKLKLVFSRSLTLFPVPMVEQDGDNGASWFVAQGTPWFERIQRDELSLREVTRRFYLQTAKLDKFLRKKRKDRLSVPALYLLVEADTLMDNVKMEADASSRATDTVLKYFQGGPESKHFLLFTQDGEPAYLDILRFLDGRASEIEGAQRPQ